MYINRHTNILFDGLITATMVFAAEPPTGTQFKLGVVSNGNSRIKINGELAGVAISERMSFDAQNTDLQYTRNFFDNIISVTGDKFDVGATLTITSVDSVYQAVVWNETHGPFGCTFSTLGGLESQYYAKSIGLLSTVVRYVRVEYRAPVSMDMEFTISPGYDDKVFVPTGNFNRVTLPGIYIPTDFEFYATDKI